MKTCGDSQKAKEVVVNFGKTSTLHGASRVCLPQKSSKCSSLLYTALMAFCFLSVALIIASLLYDMLNKDSTIINSVNQDFSSGLLEDPQYFPQYPRITLCRNPSFKIDLNKTFLSIVEYAALSFGYPFISLTPRETAMIIQLGMVNISADQNLEPKLNAFKQNLMRQENRYQVLKRMNTHFDLKKFMLENGVRCENFFSHCMASTSTFNCCDSFKPILTSFGLCYTFESLTEVDETSRSMDMKFTFIFDLLSPPDIGGPVPRGFSVFFTDPVSEFYIAEASKGEKIFPDKITEITVTLEKWSREVLHTSWHKLTNHCPTVFFDDPNDTRDPERYTIDECLAYFIFALYRNSCHCESIRYLGDSAYRHCEPFDAYTCLLNTIIQNNMSKYQQACQEPCIQYKYKTQASYIGFGQKDKTRVEIIYDSRSFTYHQYERTSTFCNFLSQLGGSLGFYFGASIVTVIETVIFTLSWIWYKVSPFKNIKIQPSSNKKYDGLHKQKNSKHLSLSIAQQKVENFC